MKLINAVIFGIIVTFGVCSPWVVAKPLCSIDDVLDELNIDFAIDTYDEFKEVLGEKYGVDAPIFHLFLENMNPNFTKQGEISLQDAIWVTKMVKSKQAVNFSRALKRVDLNPDSPIPIHEAKALIVNELVKVNDIFLTNGVVGDLKVVVTHDNVTTFWPELKGVHPPGHPEGTTWDDIMGSASMSGKPEMVIALKKNSDGKWVLPESEHGSINIVLHEFGHLVDAATGKRFFQKQISGTSNFYAA